MIDKTRWVRTAADKKKLRDEIQDDICPICGRGYGVGMLRAALDHNHDTGRVRGKTCSACNLWEGRVVKYYRKLFGTFDNYEKVVEKLAIYLKQAKLKEKEMPFHYGIVEMEKRRIKRWRKETIYQKLVDKDIVLNPIAKYTKDELSILWLDKFIEEVENDNL